MKTNDNNPAIAAFQHFVRREPPTEFRAQPSTSRTKKPQQSNYKPPNPEDETEVSSRSRLRPMERHNISVQQENFENRQFPLRYYLSEEQTHWLESKGAAPTTPDDPVYDDIDTSRPISTEYKAAYELAKERRGSAEYLATLLEAPDFGCPHFPKLKCGLGSTIPPILGFFHDVSPTAGDSKIDVNSKPAKAIQAGEWYISRLRTGKLCEECFKLAAPNGFNTWSLTYSNMGKAWNLPPQVVAGQEKFENGGVIPKDRLIFSPDVDRNGATYGYAAPEHGKGVFEFLEHLGDPFYIDLLHLEPPFDDNFKHPELENIRVNTMNAPAYLGARFIVADADDGGKGVSSSLEMRIAAAAGRLISCPKPDEFESLERGELPASLNTRKLRTEPMMGMLSQQWPVGPVARDDLHRLCTPPAPGGMATDNPLASIALVVKQRSYLSATKVEKFQTLLSAVEDWSCPPGYPHFFNLTIADYVDRLQLEVTRFDPFNGVDDLSPQEAYKTIRQALQFRRWRQPDDDWFFMRDKTVSELNSYLEECDVPSDYWLNPQVPAELSISMPNGSEKWRRWQKYREEKPGLWDREMFPGYKSQLTKYEKWAGKSS